MALVITMGITVLFTVIIGSQFSEYVETGQTASLVAALICLLIYVTAFIFRPLRYSITAEELIIHRPLWNVRLKRSRIRSAVLVDKSLVQGSIRTFGVGGLFGYFGEFANFAVGRMTWYGTRMDRIVLVTTVFKKKIILSPNEAERFVGELMSQEVATREALSTKST